MAAGDDAVNARMVQGVGDVAVNGRVEFYGLIYSDIDSLEPLCINGPPVVIESFWDVLVDAKTCP
jgi:hypothetical protein